MTDWVIFEEGQYRVVDAFLVSPRENAVPLRETVIDVFTGRTGIRQIRGKSMVRNILVVELLEDGDPLDLLLDFGHEFKFLMRDPIIQGGKVFAPDVQSVIHIFPRIPWEQISMEAFQALSDRLNFISP
jgi:hypothetical protein